MSYQNVDTPRFYVNALEWLTSSLDRHYHSFTTLPSNHFRTLPVRPTTFESENIDLSYGGAFNLLDTDLINPFCFILGHSGLSSIEILRWDEGAPISVIDTTGIQINEDAMLNGWSLLELNATPRTITASGQIGSIIIGSYYDMPNAPNLSLTMSREYGGTKEFTTYNGSSMSNTMWSRPPLWGYESAWELYASPDYSREPHQAKSGRRTWDLKFSYMDDGDLWGSNQMLSTRESTTGLKSSDIIEDSIVEATLYEGFNPIEGGSWSIVDGVGDHYSWTNTHGLFSTVDIDITDIISTYSEFSGKLKGVVAMGSAGAATWLTAGVGSPLGGLASLEVGKYYNVSIENSPEPFTTELFNTGTGLNSAYNLLTDDSFFSQVWHKTLGGTLPFIFQPDNSNNNPDQFAICKFKNNSLKVTQSAFNVYDISLSIEEVW